MPSSRNLIDSKLQHTVQVLVKCPVVIDDTTGLTGMLLGSCKHKHALLGFSVPLLGDIQVQPAPGGVPSWRCVPGR